MSNRCTVCGGMMIGDGLHFPLQCENATVPEYAESDSGPWYCEILPEKPAPLADFPTGSQLVVGIEPSDRDFVYLFESEDKVNIFADSIGSDKKLYGDSKFVSVRDGEANYLCTADLEFFYRFKAYSGALSRLQLEDKADRVELAKACLYWEGQPL